MALGMFSISPIEYTRPVVDDKPLSTDSVSYQQNSADLGRGPAEQEDSTPGV